MRKSRLIIGLASLVFTCSVLSLKVGLCSSNNSYSLETARKLGPEKMIRYTFEKFLSKEDYTNPQSVYVVRQYIHDDLYPGDQAAFKKAVCTLGECLKESGNYTNDQSDKVVRFMLRFKED